MNRKFLVLLVSAAIGVGVLMAGAGGSKVEASQPTSGGDSSTTTQQQRHKGGLDPALEKSLDAAFKKSFQQSGVPGAIARGHVGRHPWGGEQGLRETDAG